MYVFLTFFLSLSSFGQGTPIITMIADGDESGGTPEVLEIYANGAVDFSQYSLQNQTNGGTTWGNDFDLSPLGTVTDAFVYVYSNKNNSTDVFASNYPSVTANTLDATSSSILNINGDDRVRIIETGNGTVIDNYGVENEDGSNKPWEYTDGYAKRINGTGPDAVFVEANWEYHKGELNTHGAVQDGTTYESIIGIGSYTPAAACDTPTGGTAADITDTQADLSWTNGGSETAWNIEYGTTGFTQGQGTIVNVTTNPYTLTGLSADTSYDFYVQADCGNGNTSDWAGPFTFTTATATPVCGDTFYDDGGATGSYSANLNLSFTIYPQNAGDVVTVTFNSFDMEQGYDGMMVYDGTDTNAPLIDSGSTYNHSACPNGAWTGGSGGNYTADGRSFTSTDASGALTFVFTSDSSVQHDGWEATVTCAAPPTCPAPSDLTAANITSDSADLSWTAGGNETAWNIEYGPTGFAQGQGTTVNVTTNPYTLTGLTGNTSYDIYVQADCGAGDTSTWVGPYTFTTACGVYTPDYSEDFTDFLPGCWEEAQGPASGPTTTGSSTWTSDGFANNGTTGSARVNLYSNSHEEWLISPVFDLSGGNYELSFDVAVTAYSDDTASPMGSDDEVQLLVSTDNGATWSSLMTWNASNTPSNTGDNITFGLSNYPQNNVQFAFWASDGTVDDSEDYNFYVDNFAIQTVIACEAPTNLSADNITDVQADLSWTAGGSETAWNIEYGPTGFAQGQGTIVNATSNPYSLTGLTADTSYDFYVQADCGNGNTSDWAGPYSFTTATAAPVCGDTFYDDGGATGPYSANLNQSFTIYPQNVGDVVTVTFNSFDMEQGYDGMMVYNGADTNAPLMDSGSTFNRTNCPNGAWTGAPGDPYTADGVSFTSTDASGALTFVFTSDGSVQHDGWEAVVTCGPPPSCLAPTDLTASNISIDSADLSWTAGGNETAWNIEYGPTGFAQGQGTIINVTSNPYTLTGLTSATAYDFYVQADCGNGDTSTWVGPYTFVTACNVVSTFPYDYGFEDLTSNAGGDWSASCWSANPENTGSDSFSGPYRWTPTDGSTPSSGTGPSAANSGSMYAYTEASGSNEGDIAELISPTFDMSNLTQPELKFYYFMYGADMGSLHVDTYDGNSWTEDVWSISGAQQTSDSDAWIQVTVSIPNTVTRIKFRSVRGADYHSDMAVDDITISETVSVNELTNISAIYPNPTTGQFIIKSHDLNDAKVSVYTMTGKEIYHNTIDNDTYMVNLTDVRKGVYFVKIISENKSYVTKLIVK